ncbi:MAG: HNH endonuclease [Mariniblastus sp.]
MEQSSVLPTHPNACDSNNANGQSSGSALQGSVLVLNRFYMAVHVISVRRALVLLYRELAEVIHVEDGLYQSFNFENWLESSEFEAAEIEDEGLPFDPTEWVRSVNFSIRAPLIIRLNYYDKVPKLTLRFNRKNLFARDRNLCQYCGQSRPPSQLSFDHVMPSSRGGKTSWENVVCCCLACNGKKGDLLPEEAGMSLIQKPVRPRQNPLLSIKLNNPKYKVWRTFLKGSPFSVEG